MYRAVVLTSLVVLLLAAAGVAIAGGSRGGDSTVPPAPQNTSLEPTVVQNQETSAPGDTSSKPDAAEDTSEPDINTEPTVGETAELTATEPVQQTPAPSSKPAKVSGKGLVRPEHATKTSENSEPEERGNEREHGRGAGQQKVTLCHKGKNTITVGDPAREAHLRHGDTVGPCQSEGAAPEPSEKKLGPGEAQGGDGSSGNGQDKVTLCHKGKTLMVGGPAKEAHLRHGDSLGPC